MDWWIDESLPAGPLVSDQEMIERNPIVTVQTPMVGQLIQIKSGVISQTLMPGDTYTVNWTMKLLDS